MSISSMVVEFDERDDSAKEGEDVQSTKGLQRKPVKGAQTVESPDSLTSQNISIPKRIELEPGEFPVLLVRQHWFVFRDPVLVALFVPFLMLSGVFFVGFAPISEMVISTSQTLLTWGAGLAFLIGLFMFLWQWFLWKRTFYIVTNKRIILVTQRGMFSHDDRETSLAMIQDVKAEVDGLQATVYGFGDVVIQVSSEDARLVFEKVGKPHEIQRVVMREAHLREE